MADSFTRESPKSICKVVSSNNDISTKVRLFTGLVIRGYKQLLDEVVVTSRVIKVEVRVISRSQWLRLITLR